jgi:hypothetical protein
MNILENLMFVKYSFEMVYRQNIDNKGDVASSFDEGVVFPMLFLL